MGIITPFNHHRYMAGLDKNLHVNIPIRAKIDIDTENNKVWAELKPLDAKHYQKLAEYSTVAYTTTHDILDLSPPAQEEYAQKIHVRTPQKVTALLVIFL